MVRDRALRVVSFFFPVRRAKRARNEIDQAQPFLLASRGFARARVKSLH